MTTWGVVLDPPQVGPSRTSLDLNDTSSTGAIRVDQAGVDWGDAAIQAYASDALMGSNVVDYRLPNRRVTLPLFLGASTGNSITDRSLFLQARAGLQRKVALLQREGGVLLRRTDVDNLYADVVHATLTVPDKWSESGAIESDVHLTLECIPDFYGDEITLDLLPSNVGIGTLTGPLYRSASPAVIAGDYPARCRILITTSGLVDQRGLIWGFRSRHYDSTATAALVIEAEWMTVLNGATITNPYFGASSNQAVTHNALPAGVWIPMLSTVLSSGSLPLTHIGKYRVWARCISSSATPQYRLSWAVGGLTAPVVNDPVKLPNSGDFYLLNLGTIDIESPPLGSAQWTGIISANAVGAADPATVDCLYFQPLEESAGQLSYVYQPPASSIATTEQWAGSTSDNNAVGSNAWANFGNATRSPNNVFAGVQTAGTSHYLKTASHGFGISSFATILGIQVEIVRKAVQGYSLRDNQVKLVKAGTVVGNNYATSTAWPTTSGSAIYGGPNDRWGTTWAYSDINSSTFGVALSVVLFTSLAAAYVDAIGITVFYTLASGLAGAIPEDAVVYSGDTAEIRTDGAYRTYDGTTYSPVSTVLGDLPRVPPSGLESRQVELMVRPSEGDLNTLPDTTMDDFSAQVKYRPCYLFRP